MSYLDVIEEFERERSHRVFTWKDFHPDLDPTEWEVRETESGTVGRKVTEDDTGLVGFFIPRERLERGPSGKPATSPKGLREAVAMAGGVLPVTVKVGRTEWSFDRLMIGADSWVVGRCADAIAEIAWPEKGGGDAGTTSVKGKALESCPAPRMEMDL